MAADYSYYCQLCRRAWDESVDDYWMQPCPECGKRTEPYRVSGIPYVPKEWAPGGGTRWSNTFGCEVKSAKHEEQLRQQHGLVQMDKSEWKKNIKEPIEHELWKQENGKPAFETPVQMPSVAEVADGLERARMRLKYDEQYRKRFDPSHPEFKHTNRGPEN